MAFRQGAVSGQPGSMMRLGALVMLFLALSLGVWRAASLLTGSEPISRSPAEISLAGLIDPVAGPGNFRLAISHNPEGGRTVFLLLDADAAAASADLQRILPDAAGLDFKRGDKLIIEQTSFARGLPGRLDTAGWLELGGLGLIALISASMALATLRPGAVQVSGASPLRYRDPSAATARPESVRPLRPVPAAPAPEAADLARRDPARAAAVLRGWMHNGGDVS